MGIKMNITTGRKRRRKKLGTSTFDNHFRISPMGDATQAITSQKLQPLRWLPDGWGGHILRNPAAAFAFSVVLAVMVSLVRLLIKSRTWTLLGLRGLFTMLTCDVTFTKTHRAHCPYANRKLFS
ncbi:MAG: hypothetical protein RSD57_03925 [Comamonas sp.]